MDSPEIFWQRKAGEIIWFGTEGKAECNRSEIKAVVNLLFNKPVIHRMITFAMV